MKFDDYLDKMSLLVNEGKLEPDILAKCEMLHRN